MVLVISKFVNKLIPIITLFFKITKRNYIITDLSSSYTIDPSSNAEIFFSFKKNSYRQNYIFIIMEKIGKNVVYGSHALRC